MPSIKIPSKLQQPKKCHCYAISISIRNSIPFPTLLKLPMNICIKRSLTRFTYLLFEFWLPNQTSESEKGIQDSFECDLERTLCQETLANAKLINTYNLYYGYTIHRYNKQPAWPSLSTNFVTQVVFPQFMFKTCNESCNWTNLSDVDFMGNPVSQPLECVRDSQVKSKISIVMRCTAAMPASYHCT